MKKIIFRSLVAVLVEAALHEQRLKACGYDKLLIDKEERRYESNPLWVGAAQETGDPGRIFTNHGCEARGI